MPGHRASQASIRGALLHASAPDIGDVLIVMPAGQRFPEVILNKVDAYLVARFPDYRFAIAPGAPDGDHGFIAIPIAGTYDDEDEVKLREIASASVLNDIADALEEFRASGWKRRLH